MSITYSLSLRRGYSFSNDLFKVSGSNYFVASGLTYREPLTLSSYTVRFLKSFLVETLLCLERRVCSVGVVIVKGL